ncbi:hypothetical protein PCASD_23006 [Puccinia coronata f. sp. avenae]|uniref:Velvet domain-containing protein n=1 Tax=Puccinia coronata f. sp. avenae TaxID=200324 RepID=A0A2N5TN56_9BASI|nr:hypothetical protein PCASD_23006 [Puccinia coronata f. sp. avenae]
MECPCGEITPPELPLSSFWSSLGLPGLNGASGAEPIDLMGPPSRSSPVPRKNFRSGCRVLDDLLLMLFTLWTFSIRHLRPPQIAQRRLEWLTTWEAVFDSFTISIPADFLSGSGLPAFPSFRLPPSTQLVPYFIEMYPSTSTHNPQAGRSSVQTRHYELRILQQPVRARMCGFGDKDRRLLTPPVIVELLILESQTGMQINISEVDTSFFVLNADLWDSRGAHEQNIVMHPVFYNPDSAANYLSSSEDKPSLPEPSSRRPAASTSSHFSSTIAENPAKSTGEMAYTRNLIGALAQSGSKLKGMDEQPSIFFIFHDLSIRTEGIFCLRFTLVVLGHTDQPTDILASTFSEPFQVYSAKKFPGMLGPTALTRHFSAQRVRIPTRRRKAKDEGMESTDEDGEDDDT